MTDVHTDVVTALSEDIASRIAGISRIKNSGFTIYSPDQIEVTQQRLQTPCVLYHYAGMQPENRKHKVVFFIYLIDKAQNLTSTKSNLATLNKATIVLQELRKSMACSKSPTNSHWFLDSEIPTLPEGDKIIYRQRWSTDYHISN